MKRDEFYAEFDINGENVKSCPECDGDTQGYSCCGDEVDNNEDCECPTCKEHCTIEVINCQKCKGHGVIELTESEIEDRKDPINFR